MQSKIKIGVDIKKNNKENFGKIRDVGRKPLFAQAVFIVVGVRTI